MKTNIYKLLDFLLKRLSGSSLMVNNINISIMNPNGKNGINLMLSDKIYVDMNSNLCCLVPATAN
jgi:hypothetical protein